MRTLWENWICKFFICWGVFHLFRGLCNNFINNRLSTIFTICNNWGLNNTEQKLKTHHSHYYYTLNFLPCTLKENWKGKVPLYSFDCEEYKLNICQNRKFLLSLEYCINLTNYFSSQLDTHGDLRIQGDWVRYDSMIRITLFESKTTLIFIKGKYILS